MYVISSIVIDKVPSNTFNISKTLKKHEPLHLEPPKRAY
jgi:hypothetical protein